MIEEPHWERGYRCLGYWQGSTRLGEVILSRPGHRPVRYLASVESPERSRMVEDLKAAKRWVEMMLS
jgi:hypothetical protein